MKIINIKKLRGREPSVEPVIGGLYRDGAQIVQFTNEPVNYEHCEHCAFNDSGPACSQSPCAGGHYRLVGYIETGGEAVTYKDIQ